MAEKQDTYYIAGPMTGIPYYNFSAFHAVTSHLRRQMPWAKVINPAEEDIKHGFDAMKLPEGTNWKEVPDGFDFQASATRDLQGVMEADCIVMLEGWENSKGAKTEKAVAEWMKKDILYAYVDPAPEGIRSSVRILDAPAPPIVVDMQTASKTEVSVLNPKDAIGSDKLPLHLWPETATAQGCIGMLNGMLKYGRSNFRAIGIRASIYVDAAKRHINAWFEGEENDPDDGVPHLSAALACLAIIVDAQATGKMTDDRNVAGGYRKLVHELTPHVARLKSLHKDRDPKHYTITDNKGETK